MSGRVGDLSPKQEEALAKVGPHPGPAPAPGPGPLPAAAASWEGAGLGTSDGPWRAGRMWWEQQRAAPGILCSSGPPLLPPPAKEALGKFGHPGPSPEQAPRGPTQEEVVAWKP